MNAMKPVRNKVVAYITRLDPRAGGHQLLTFRHTQYPDAGIQVPAGTLRAGEEPAQGALREAQEESGLQGLALVSFLGTRDFDCSPYGKDQIHHRHFYHFEALGDLPGTWLNLETDPSEGEETFYEFEFSWAKLPGELPALTGEQDGMVPALLQSIDHASRVRQCYNLAQSALRKGNQPFGALLVKDGEVLMTAENTVASDRDVTRHAELNLVSQAARRFPPEVLSKATLYTSTEPCVMCTGAIEWAGIREIVFGVSAEALARWVEEPFVLSSRLILGEGRSQARVIGPVLEDEGLRVLQSLWTGEGPE